MSMSSYTIYVDESGDHSLQKINAEFPLFVLTFCLIEKREYQHQIIPRFTEFKQNWFGHDAIILHAHEIRKQKGDFTFLNNRVVRTRFMDELNDLMHTLPYLLITSAIDKRTLTTQYTYPDNPYSIAMQFCLERAYMCLNERGQGSQITHILVESRGQKEDKDLELTFRRICDGANLCNCRLPFEVKFVDKKQNLNGLQLADLVCHPIARNILNPAQQNRAYDIVSQKLRRSGGGKVQGYGLKVFP